ncbi:hypothetical protein OESDEN_08531 [Oesophagostomum dentatum]|uniref:Uncharacterized protein n=1 Tax=Oesophagostomum dentatum TaxID=61180 RepID=A0A0B1T645_OESDE|nr:hypothetical protein OESDEN_08531 [Oesophagostomum dentatum]
MDVVRKRKSTEFPTGDFVWTKTLLLDRFGKGVREDLAHVIVTNGLTSETFTSYVESDPVYPEFEGTVYLPIPKPRAGIVQEVSLQAVDSYGRYCQAHCFNTTVEHYQVCQPRLQVGARAESSSAISYTHSVTSRRFLDTDLSVHPRQIMVSTPFIVFACSRKVMTSSMITSVAESTRPKVSREPFVWFRVTLHRHVSQNLQIRAAPSSGPVWMSSVRKAASPFDPNLVYVQKQLL